MSFYMSNKDKIADAINANSFKAFSVGPGGIVVPASELERQINKEDKAAAVARLCIDKAMIASRGS